MVGDQFRNKQAAFEKCCQTKQFLAWHRTEVMRRLGTLKEIDRTVDEMMLPHNLRIEEFSTGSSDKLSNTLK